MVDSRKRLNKRVSRAVNQALKKGVKPQHIEAILQLHATHVRREKGDPKVDPADLPDGVDVSQFYDSDGDHDSNDE